MADGVGLTQAMLEGKLAVRSDAAKHQGEMCIRDSDALEMARWSRGTRLEGLVAHSDAGSQFTSIRFGERLAEIGAVPSIGTVGDSYDNALAEAVNALYKTELIRGPAQGPWRKMCIRDSDEVEAVQYGTPPGTFSTWEEFESDTDVLFYEGLHGACLLYTSRCV